jgi:hypothetical protein
MSNNDDMEIDIDIGCGLRGTKDKSVQQKARGNKSDHRGLEERERATTAGVYQKTTTVNSQQ